MKRMKFSPFFFGIALVLSACGKQAFVPGVVDFNSNAPGAFEQPPKVDILMGIDTTGNMKNAYPRVRQEIPTFLNNLNLRGWDFRFITVDVSAYTNPSTVTFDRMGVSRYDTFFTRLGTWMPPFPGAQSDDRRLRGQNGVPVDGSFFPDSLSSTPNDGLKPGIENQINFLQRPDINVENGSNSARGFVRRDALLAVLTLSSADDTSGGRWVPGNNGAQVFQPITPLSTYIDQLRRMKESLNLIRYYALTSQNRTEQCGLGGGYATPGTRYRTMADALGGSQIDICTTPLATALDSLGTQLNSFRLAYRKLFIVLGSEPNVSTIRVRRLIAGNPSNAVTIPNDATNGWTYAGFRTDQYTTELPAQNGSPAIPMNLATGYMIELHGNARMSGNDQAEVNFVSAGDPSAG